MGHCKKCGGITITNICLACGHTFVSPPQLQNAVLFDVNPFLKKRLEWRENIRRNTGMPTLPADPTKLNLDDVPQDTSLDELELLRKKLKRKEIEHLEF